MNFTVVKYVMEGFGSGRQEGRAAISTHALRDVFDILNALLPGQLALGRGNAVKPSLSQTLPPMLVKGCHARNPTQP